MDQHERMSEIYERPPRASAAGKKHDIHEWPPVAFVVGQISKLEGSRNVVNDQERQEPCPGNEVFCQESSQGSLVHNNLSLE